MYKRQALYRRTFIAAAVNVAVDIIVPVDFSFIRSGPFAAGINIAWTGPCIGSSFIHFVTPHPIESACPYLQYKGKEPFLTSSLYSIASVAYTHLATMISVCVGSRSNQRLSPEPTLLLCVRMQKSQAHGQRFVIFKYRVCPSTYATFRSRSLMWIPPPTGFQMCIRDSSIRGYYRQASQGMHGTLFRLRHLPTARKRAITVLTAIFYHWKIFVSSLLCSMLEAKAFTGRLHRLCWGPNQSKRVSQNYGSFDS